MIMETKEIVKKEEGKVVPILRGTSLFFDIAKFEHAQRVAQVFAKSTMVPVQFQGNIANCVIALNLSERMQTDPFMLMQNMYIVHGRPGIEAKLAIGLINQSGKFSELEYEMIGEKKDGDSFGCRAYAKRLSTRKVLYGPKVDIAMAKAEGWYNKAGSKWKTMPELMLQYRAAMFFARTYCPDVLLGMLTRDELQDIIDISPTEYEDSENPEPPKVSKTTYQATDESHLLITSFSKLNKEPLKKFEENHRDKIQTWPEDVQRVFTKKWETKMKMTYEDFLRKRKIINGEEQEMPVKKELTLVMSTVVCPETKEAYTLHSCQNRHGAEKPCERYFEEDCLARWSE